MPLVFQDPLSDAQWLRAAGHSCSAGAEVSECFAVARQIREPDAESWFKAWYALAEALLTEAEKSRASGPQVSALGAFLRASNYFRAAYTFLIGAPVDSRVVDAYRRHRAAFEAAVALMRPPAERIAIPYGNATMHGYLFRAGEDGVPRPTLIINGGYDSTAEEAYLFSGAAAVSAGSAWALALLKIILTRRLRHTTAGWALRRGLWVHGVADPLAYIRLTRDYTLEGRAERIHCPTLVCRAENDDIGVTARKLYDSLVCEKAFITFLAKEGAGEHCEAGARSLFNQRAFDWLDLVFKR